MFKSGEINVDLHPFLLVVASGLTPGPSEFQDNPWKKNRCRSIFQRVITVLKGFIPKGRYSKDFYPEGSLLQNSEQ